ncbi:YlbF family regulator, partial [Lacticaseibacillus paracasei]
LKLDTVAYGLFQQFQQKQYEMQQKSMQGQDFTDDEVKSLQELGDKMRDIQPIQNLMAKEQGLSQMMDELNKIISQPIIDVYQGK